MLLQLSFLTGLFLLLSVAHSETESNLRSSTNASRILDSINKDLDEIKRTLAQAQASRNRSLSGDSLVGKSDKVKEAGHYLTPLKETTDRQWVSCATPTDDDNIYKYSIPYLNQSLGQLDFAQYRGSGKPLLLVNVATFCESTIEYPLYNQLKDQFGDKLVIVAFPCNQFLNVRKSSRLLE